MQIGDRDRAASGDRAARCLQGRHILGRDLERILVEKLNCVHLAAASLVPAGDDFESARPF